MLFLQLSKLDSLREKVKHFSKKASFHVKKMIKFKKKIIFNNLVYNKNSSKQKNILENPNIFFCFISEKHTVDSLIYFS